MRRVLVTGSGMLLLATTLIAHPSAVRPAAADDPLEPTINWEYSESADGYWRPPEPGAEEHREEGPRATPTAGEGNHAGVGGVTPPIDYNSSTAMDAGGTGR